MTIWALTVDGNATELFYTEREAVDTRDALVQSAPEDQKDRYGWTEFDWDTPV